MADGLHKIRVKYRKLEKTRSIDAGNRGRKTYCVESNEGAHKASLEYGEFQSNYFKSDQIRERYT